MSSPKKSIKKDETKTKEVKKRVAKTVFIGPAAKGVTITISNIVVRRNQRVTVDATGAGTLKFDTITMQGGTLLFKGAPIVLHVGKK